MEQMILKVQIPTYILGDHNAEPISNNTFDISLIDGRHTFKSPKTDISLSHQNLFDNITISGWYYYDEVNKVFGICSSNFSSENATKLHIETPHMPSIIVGCNAIDTILDDETMLSNDTQQLLINITCSINDNIIENAKEAGLNVILFEEFENISAEHQSYLFTLFQDKCFKGFYFHGYDYDKSFEVCPITSTYNGTETFKDQNFANVKGTSNDICIESSEKIWYCWRKLWEAKCNDGIEIKQCFNTYCESSSIKYIGGHIFVGKDVESRYAIDNEVVYILPICNSCNNSRNECIMHCSNSFNTVKILYHNP